MIMSERTRIYTDNTGNYDKVDVLTSYRRIGAPHSLIQEPANTPAHLMDSLLVILKIIALATVITFVSLGLWCVCSRDSDDLGQQASWMPNFQEQFSIEALKSELKATNSSSSMKKHSRNFMLMASMFEHMNCSWLHDKISCEIAS